ncbi:MAG: DUF2231 domain-containing protein [Phycisphaerae bacterium]
MKRRVASDMRYCLWLRSLAVVAALITAMGAHSRVAVAQAPVNKMCLVMRLEEADPAITTQYEGRTIAFCCENCLKKFLANPERYAGRLTAFENDAEDHAEQDHDSNIGASQSAHDHDSEETEMPLLARIHPVVVHLPLAGVPIALVAVIGWLVSRKKFFANADVPPLVLAAGSSILGVITGNVAHDSMRFSEALHEYVRWHQYAATSLMILLLILCAFRLWRWRGLKGKWLVAYATGLAMVSGVVCVVGYLGGSLVFGPDHLWP